MLNWIQEIFQHSSRLKTRRRRPVVKPSLEGLTERILPSASAVTQLPVPSPMVAVASPSVADVTSHTVAAIEQWIVTLSSDMSNAWKAIAQFANNREQFFGNLPLVPQPGSGAGSGSGAATVHNAPNQPLNVAMQQAGHGSGSGSSHTAAVHEGQSLTGSGTGTGSGSGATVNGKVWLDNNGDGSQNNGEVGFAGIGVKLIDASGKTLDTTTTRSDGSYNFYNVNASLVEIQVVIPAGDYATIYSGSSQINANGYSDLFPVAAGAVNNAPPAGLRSTVVTTSQDDPNGAIPNQVTLRDAINTVNNAALTGFGLNPTITFAASGTGTIFLQAELPTLDTKVTITGNNNTIQGNATAGNPYSIFTVSGNITAEIDNLIITGGNDQTGGGISNNGGSLTLNNDVITANTASQGGGIYNASGSSLYLTNDLIQYNTASSVGGGIANVGGTVTVTASGNPTTILGNNAGFLGGGIYNAGEGTVQFQNTVYINGNYAAANGGGVYNSSGEFTMSGGSLSANYVISTTGFGGGLYNAGGATLFSVTVDNGNEANRGAGMYLANGSSTDLTSVTVQGNQFIGNNGQGLGIYVQGNGQLILGEGVSDDDDPNGPVYGN